MSDLQYLVRTAHHAGAAAMFLECSRLLQLAEQPRAAAILVEKYRMLESAVSEDFERDHATVTEL